MGNSTAPTSITSKDVLLQTSTALASHSNTSGEGLTHQQRFSGDINSSERGQTTHCLDHHHKQQQQQQLGLTTNTLLHDPSLTDVSLLSATTASNQCFSSTTNSIDWQFHHQAAVADKNELADHLIHRFASSFDVVDDFSNSSGHNYLSPRSDDHLEQHPTLLTLVEPTSKIAPTTTSFCYNLFESSEPASKVTYNNKSQIVGDGGWDSQPIFPASDSLEPSSSHDYFGRNNLFVNYATTDPSSSSTSLYNRLSSYPSISSVPAYSDFVQRFDSTSNTNTAMNHRDRLKPHNCLTEDILSVNVNNTATGVSPYSINIDDFQNIPITTHTYLDPSRSAPVTYVNHHHPMLPVTATDGNPLLLNASSSLFAQPPLQHHLADGGQQLSPVVVTQAGGTSSSRKNSSSKTTATRRGRQHYHVDRHHIDSNYDYIVRPSDPWMNQYSINNLIDRGSCGQRRRSSGGKRQSPMTSSATSGCSNGDLPIFSITNESQAVFALRPFLKLPPKFNQLLLTAIWRSQTTVHLSVASRSSVQPSPDSSQQHCSSQPGSPYKCNKDSRTLNTSSSSISSFDMANNPLSHSTNLFCSICKISLPHGYAAKQHFKSTQHIQQFDPKGSNFVANLQAIGSGNWCPVCNIDLRNPNVRRTHQYWDQHKKAVMDLIHQPCLNKVDLGCFTSSTTSLSSPNTVTNQASTPIADDVLKCSLCQVMLSDDNQAKQHFESGQHVASLHISGINVVGNLGNWCPTCNVDLRHHRQAHLTGARHESAINHLIKQSPLDKSQTANRDNQSGHQLTSIEIRLATLALVKQRFTDLEKVLTSPQTRTQLLQASSDIVIGGQPLLFHMSVDQLLNEFRSICRDEFISCLSSYTLSTYQ